MFYQRTFLRTQVELPTQPTFYKLHYIRLYNLFIYNQLLYSVIKYVLCVSIESGNWIAIQN